MKKNSKELQKLLNDIQFGDLRTPVMDLANKAKPENWSYLDLRRGKPLQALWTYLASSYEMSHKKHALSYSAEYKSCLWNTGLVDTSGLEIFGVLHRARKRTHLWKWKQWCTADDNKVIKHFPKLPKNAHKRFLIDQPPYDLTRPVVCNLSHIANDNVQRLPEALRDMSITNREGVLTSAIEHHVERVQRGEGAPVPQYYAGEVGYFLKVSFKPYFQGQTVLALQDTGMKYIAATCLYPQWAYARARVVGVPPADWITV